MIKLLLWSFAALGGLYLFAVASLFLFQRRVIYPAPKAQTFVLPAGFKEITLRTTDGLALKSAYRPPHPGRPTLVFFHGNGDNVEGASVATRSLRSLGFGLLLIEYRGYGGNPGWPSEQGLYRDGRAALEWLARHEAGTSAVTLVGNSLGSGVATQLASDLEVDGLALISGFTSLPAVAAEHLRYVPARLLVRDRYDNESKLAAIRTDRVLILHGTEDKLIRPSHAETLARAFPRATLKLIPNAGHELAYPPEAQAVIARWAEGIDRP